jgi:hypothetical protein
VGGNTRDGSTPFSRITKPLEISDFCAAIRGADSLRQGLFADRSKAANIWAHPISRCQTLSMSSATEEFIAAQPRNIGSSDFSEVGELVSRQVPDSVLQRVVGWVLSQDFR